MYLCVRGIDFASYYDFYIWFWKCFDSVVFYIFHFIVLLFQSSYYIVGTNVSFSISSHLQPQTHLLSLETSKCLSISKTNRCAPIRILYKDDRLPQFINLSTCNAPIICTIKNKFNRVKFKNNKSFTYKSIAVTAIGKGFDCFREKII